MLLLLLFPLSTMADAFIEVKLFIPPPPPLLLPLGRDTFSPRLQMEEKKKKKKKASALSSCCGIFSFISITQNKIQLKGNWPIVRIVASKTRSLFLALQMKHNQSGIGKGE